MNIHAITVCVDYADLLAYSIPRLAPHLASWTVVTSSADTETQALAREHGLTCRVTDVFYERGAAFNKGAAIEEARLALPGDDGWLLLVDADIVPEAGWFERVAAHGCEPGNLYSAWRYQCETPDDIDDPRCPRIDGDGLGVGYWQLMHRRDPLAQVPVPVYWKHAGVYDCEIKNRWDRRRRKELPIRLYHLSERDNWFGRGRKAEFEAMMDERRRRGGKWDHERIDTD